MTTVAVLSVTVALGYAGYRRWMVPACPRCRSKNWDRRLCRPLLFCRACATRCDSALQLYN